ncbi:hypothetical protein D3C76_1815020 [compost metagenome]
MNNAGCLILMLHQASHANRLQRIEQKMGVDLAVKCIQLGMSTLNLQIFSLNIGHINIVNQSFDSQRHPIKFTC